MNALPIVVDMDVSESIQQIDCDVSELTQTISADIDIAIVTSDTPPYTGDYVVIPKTNEQTLPTNGLRMTDDVSIRSIPYYEVSNTNGLTVYIAQDINDY